MKIETCFKRALLGTLLVAATATADDSNQLIIESSKAMEREHDLTITDRLEMARLIRRSQQIPPDCTLVGPSISPDGTVLVWSLYSSSPRIEETSFVLMSSRDGIQRVQLKGKIAIGSGISTGAEIIAALCMPVGPLSGQRREFLVIDRRAGLVVHDLTQAVTQQELGNNLESLSVSGTGTLVALGTREPEEMRVLEIPSGKTVSSGPGRFPRISPDGTRMAFVHHEMIWIHSFADGSTKGLSGIKRVNGVGSWSPDGRFLLAGAWVMMPSFERQEIVVDVRSTEYGIVRNLAEGEYGNHLAWISTKLLNRR